MAQKQGQVQTQVERMVQKLSPQQLAVARLLELSVVELEEAVKTEVDDNMALEEGRDNEAENNSDNDFDNSDDFTDNDPNERDHDELDEDSLPIYAPSSGKTDTEMPIGETRSFIDDLKQQISEFDVTEKQHDLVEYLIGTLDNNGYVDRPLSRISDDLICDFYIDASVAEIEEALHILQQFEPAGIGARDLRECLLLQLVRKLESAEEGPRQQRLEVERRILADFFDLWKQQHLTKLEEVLGVSSVEFNAAIEGIKRLNPRPGRALCESADERAQTVVPDFVIETSMEGQIRIELNNGEVPELKVSRDSIEQLKALEQIKNSQHMSEKLKRSQMDGLEYTKSKVEAAQLFIEAIKQRHKTMYSVMKAITDVQRDFILTQDETKLIPMRLEDIAQRTHMDRSTVSRVRKGKYVLIDGEQYSLDFFFLRARTNADGDALEHKEIKQAIKDLIDAEDKHKPLSDEKICKLLDAKQKISRRTVAKYRDEMGIPSSQDRKIV